MIGFTLFGVKIWPTILEGLADNCVAEYCVVVV